MANIKEIQDRMRSIQDTLKITNAMYMISTSKLKKSKKMLADTEPYFFALQSEMSRILRHLPEFEDIYFESDSAVEKKPEEKRVGYIVITADKGLAGAYNHNVIKIAEKEIEKHPNSKIYIIGQVGMHYFEHRNVEFSHSFKYTIQNPTLSRARSIAETLLDSYLRDKVDEVYIIYTKMINSMSSEAEMLKLLPMDKGDFKTDELLETGERTEYEFMPSSDVVFDTIVPNWLSGLVYGALVEAYCSEQNSRMMAMQTATDSAKEMLHDLEIEYNRVRQAAITQEITEIVGGAECL